MRSFIFNISFYAVTVFFALFCVLLSLLPGAKAVQWGIRIYTKTMVWLMRHVAGIDIKVRGHENLPKQGPYILAPKHQSYGDGFVIYAEFKDNLVFVAGDHLEKFMTVKRILQKLGAVIIDSCGGSGALTKLRNEAKRITKEGKILLIYPEGHLSRIGTHHRFRKGVYHLYNEFNCPVVPVATNLGQRWNQNDWKKHKGSAVLEFLDPIMPGLKKDEFMQQLQAKIEGRSLELLDMENLGALNPDDIGQLRENKVARAKRLKREQEERARRKSGQ